MLDAEKLYYLKGQLIAIKYMGNSYNPHPYRVLTQYNIFTGKGDFGGDFTRDNAIGYIKTQFPNAVAVKPDSVIEIKDDMGGSWGYADSVTKAKGFIYKLAKGMPHSVFYLFRYRDNKSFAKAIYDNSKKRVIYEDGKVQRLYADGHTKQIEDFKFPILMRY